MAQPRCLHQLGNSITNVGCGQKIADGPHASNGDLSVSLTDNPAIGSASAIVSGIAGRTAQVRVVNILGGRLCKTPVPSALLPRTGQTMPLDVTGWPSGMNYIIPKQSRAPEAPMLRRAARFNINIIHSSVPGIKTRYGRVF